MVEVITPPFTGNLVLAGRTLEANQRVLSRELQALKTKTLNEFQAQFQKVEKDISAYVADKPLATIKSQAGKHLENQIDALVESTARVFRTDASILSGRAFDLINEARGIGGLPPLPEANLFSVRSWVRSDSSLGSMAVPLEKRLKGAWIGFVAARLLLHTTLAHPLAFGIGMIAIRWLDGAAQKEYVAGLLLKAMQQTKTAIAAELSACIDQTAVEFGTALETRIVQTQLDLAAAVKRQKTG